MYCYKCGKEINDESHYCKYCGTEQMSYKLAKPEDNNYGWITKNSLNKLIRSTGFKIYILLLGFWSISWLNDWFYLDEEEYEARNFIGKMQFIKESDLYISKRKK